MRGFLAVLLEDLEPALHVLLVDHVSRDDLAALAVLAHHVVVLRSALRVLERRLRAVVRLVPGADHLHLRPALAEGLERLRVLRTVGSLHGFCGQAEPSDAKNEISGSRPGLGAGEPLLEPGGLLRPFSATFHDGK
jgi:hypothetical protein